MPPGRRTRSPAGASSVGCTSPSSPEVKEIFGYLLGYCLREYGLQLRSTFMGNHYHLEVRDVHGNYPVFKSTYNGLVTRCFGVARSRWSGTDPCRLCGGSREMNANIHALWFHAGMTTSPSGYDKPRVTAQLRPSTGDLVHELFDEIDQLAGAIAQHGEPVDRIRAAYALHQVARTVQSWALDPDGMLQRNALLSQDDGRTLRRGVRRWQDAAQELMRYHPEVRTLELSLPIE